MISRKISEISYIFQTVFSFQVRTLPHMKLTVTEEQQEKFRLSIANWCLANEGLRKSIQSLQPPASMTNTGNNPLSSILSSESLASICSGLQAIEFNNNAPPNANVLPSAEIIEEIDTKDEPLEENDEVSAKMEMPAGNSMDHSGMDVESVGAFWFLGVHILVT